MQRIAGFPIWFLGALLLPLLFLLHDPAGFLGAWRTGLLVGAGVVVLVLFPFKLREFERRVAALEASARERDAGT